MNEQRKPDFLAARLTAVRRRLAAWDVDGILITSPANRRWLSGFAGSNARLLVTADQALLATDSRYINRIPAEAPHFTPFPHDRTAAATHAFVTQAGVSRIGVEANHLSLAAFDTLQQAAGIHWIPLAQTLEPLRAVKDETEAAAIRAAAAITDHVMRVVPDLVRVGMSERELAWGLEKRLRDEGADGAAFEIIVAAGPHSAHPHHTPGSRPLQAGEPLIVDMGALLDGYRSDLTRTFFLGTEPTERFRNIFDIVRGAQTAVFAGAQAGMLLKDADALARSPIAAAGFGDNFDHGLGHGLGLEIHEYPLLSPRAGSETTLAAGMFITIEPGIYIPGWGGVRIEDLALVTADGLEIVSQCSQNPLIPLV